MPDLTAWLASARAKVEAADAAPRELRDGVYLGVALRHLPALLDVAEAAAAYQEEMAALGNGVDPALSAALSALGLVTDGEGKEKSNG